MCGTEEMMQLLPNAACMSSLWCRTADQRDDATLSHPTCIVIPSVALTLTPPDVGTKEMTPPRLTPPALSSLRLRPDAAACRLQLRHPRDRRDPAARPVRERPKYGPSSDGMARTTSGMWQIMQPCPLYASRVIISLVPRVHSSSHVISLVPGAVDRLPLGPIKKGCWCVRPLQL